MAAHLTLTAYAPLDKLVHELARLGWGDLGGREWAAVRALYFALVAHHGVNNHTAGGRVTMLQLARHSGYGLRWTKTKVGQMEHAGLIEIDRGGLDIEGNPTPSYVRVSKQALVDMLATARKLRDEADRALWVAARARVAKLHSVRALYLKRWREARDKRLRRSLRGEVSARLSPPTGGSSTSPPPGGGVTGGKSWLELEVCEHDSEVGKCGTCRKIDRRRSAAAQTTGVA